MQRRVVVSFNSQFTQTSFINGSVKPEMVVKGNDCCAVHECLLLEALKKLVEKGVL